MTRDTCASSAAISTCSPRPACAATSAGCSGSSRYSPVRPLTPLGWIRCGAIVSILVHLTDPTRAPSIDAIERTPMSDVIVLLPGITGNVLQKDGHDVWALSGG